MSEPYLHAFSPPVEFFRALLSGKASLAECHYLTNPFNSWRMVLIGDPRYSPFRDRAVIREQTADGNGSGNTPGDARSMQPGTSSLAQGPLVLAFCA